MADSSGIPWLLPSSFVRDSRKLAYSQFSLHERVSAKREPHYLSGLVRHWTEIVPDLQRKFIRLQFVLEYRLPDVLVTGQALTAEASCSEDRHAIAPRSAMALSA
jgi:hypothetical protein